MSVSAISPGTNPYSGAFQTAMKQGRADLETVATAIQSLDVEGARTAYAALQQDVLNARTAWTQGVQAGQQSGPSVQLKTDFQALGSALQSADVKAAQKALATLQQDFQAIRLRHHHRHSVGAIVKGPVAGAGSVPASGSVSETGSQSGGGALDVKG
jgi:hypothetical protein